MATPYNRNFTPYKSTALQGLDCNISNGPVYHAGVTENFRSYAVTYTLAEAIEAGECISMIRLPRGLTITDAALFYTPGTAIIGVGDPFCCGRLIGPVDIAIVPGQYQGDAQGVSCAPTYSRMVKMGRGGDGCGFGYTYTCDTDLIITNGYGLNSFQQGGMPGGKNSATTGGGTAGPLASGSVLGLKVEGYMNPELTNG